MRSDDSRRATHEDPPAIFLMGPTASGKTRLAVELVRALPCEIISVDSAMIYRGMDIGTAKPSSAILQAAPHRLIDILDPVVPYSAAAFRRDALKEMAAIRHQGKIPLLVGGTMLYFRALERGLAKLPAANAEIRARIEREAQQQGWAALHERLRQVDPAAAARIHANDPQRLQRALEVFELTGTSMSAHQGQGRCARLPYRLLKLALIPNDREALRVRIGERLRRMLEQGLVDEVKVLCERGDLDRRTPSMRAVGYRQVWDYLDGRLDFATMVDNTITATRQLAKRQLTWLRREPAIEPVNAHRREGNKIVKTIAAHIG